MKKLFLLAALLAFATSPALAGGIYAGASYGWTSIKDPAEGVSVSASDRGYKLLLGYEVIKVFRVEAGYTEFGTFDEASSDQSIDVDSDAIAIWAIGNLPVSPRLDLYGKLGYASVGVSGSVTDLSGTRPIDSTTEDLGWGVGLGYRFSPSWGMSVEFESYEADSAELSLGSVGFTYSF